MLFGYVSVFHTALCHPSLEQGSPGCCMLGDKKKKKKKEQEQERGEILELNVKKRKKKIRKAAFSAKHRGAVSSRAVAGVS